MVGPPALDSLKEFSFRTRAANLRAMAAGPVDILVVGGGVVGAWVALTAAGPGAEAAAGGEGPLGERAQREAVAAHPWRPPLSPAVSVRPREASRAGARPSTADCPDPRETPDVPHPRVPPSRPGAVAAPHRPLALRRAVEGQVPPQTAVVVGPGGVGARAPARPRGARGGGPVLGRDGERRPPRRGGGPRGPTKPPPPRH